MSKIIYASACTAGVLVGLLALYGLVELVSLAATLHRYRNGPPYLPRRTGSLP